MARKNWCRQQPIFTKKNAYVTTRKPAIAYFKWKTLRVRIIKQIGRSVRKSGIHFMLCNATSIKKEHSLHHVVMTTSKIYSPIPSWMANDPMTNEQKNNENHQNAWSLSYLFIGKFCGSYLLTQMNPVQHDKTPAAFLRGGDSSPPNRPLPPTNSNETRAARQSACRKNKFWSNAMTAKQT